ncbi:secretion related GTPase SrgD like protein [Zymoseptoria brevis]|uniref:Secretion related GTPase SrgD like protein n=1 Tax=Zymoseptoria brevis TaxID=1047168 RepID=A0A0F4GXH0_9PEZI|nr:secretion related GTPase SrgD like protein [Zymoseptoria brevis]
MAQPYDYISKIVSLGDSGSGKSSLTIRLCEGRFVSHHDVTIGVEFGSRIVPVGPPASLEYNINNPSHTPAAVPAQQSAKDAKSKAPTKPKTPEQKHMKLSLWDTAGQETYKSITRSYFRGASGALLVFDISRRNTFASVTAWLHDLRQIAEDDIVVVLVGNKSDLAASSTVSGDQSAANKRQVTREEAEEWCRENKVMQYVETSAKSGENVERAFLEVAERIYQNIEAGKYDLNDRRSGVKGPGAGGGRAVTLGGPDRNAAKKAGCC